MSAGEVLRQASAVVGRPIVLWEVTGAHDAIVRASSDPEASARLPRFDLEATLRRWHLPMSVGSRWIATPGTSGGAWVVAPVRSRPPAPPPAGRERRSRERLALELTGLALGSLQAPSELTTPASPPTSPGMLVHEASNPLTAARGGLQLAMESIGRWVDLAADRRLTLLDDLGQVLEDIDRTTELLRAMRESARAGSLTQRSERGGRFDAIRVIRSCLTLERRLLRDRGIDLDFTTGAETLFLKGDSNALFDLLVNLVRNAAEAGALGGPPAAIRIDLQQKPKNLEIVVRGKGSASNLAKLRALAAETLEATVSAASAAGGDTTYTVAVPLPPQRDADRRS